MPPSTRPPRHKPDVGSMILYFAFLGVKANAVAELIELKLGTRVSPDECLQRFEFHRDVEFPNRNTSYTAEVIVGQECAKNVPVLDTFEAYTKIDAACEEILNKASLDYAGSPLAVLKDDKNPVKAAALKILIPKAQFEAQLKTYETESLSRFRPYLQLPQNNPERPQAFKEDAYDPVMPRMSRSPDGR